MCNRTIFTKYVYPYGSKLFLLRSHLAFGGDMYTIYK